MEFDWNLWMILQGMFRLCVSRRSSFLSGRVPIIRSFCVEGRNGISECSYLVCFQSIFTAFEALFKYHSAMCCNSRL